MVPTQCKSFSFLRPNGDERLAGRNPDNVGWALLNNLREVVRGGGSRYGATNSNVPVLCQQHANMISCFGVEDGSGVAYVCPRGSKGLRTKAKLAAGSSPSDVRIAAGCD